MYLSFVVVDNGGFSQSLYDRSRLVIHEFIALSRFCLKGGVGALDALIQNRLVGELLTKARLDDDVLLSIAAQETIHYLHDSLML